MNTIHEPQPAEGQIAGSHASESTVRNKPVGAGGEAVAPGAEQSAPAAIESFCMGNECPSRTRCQRYTRILESKAPVFAAFWARRDGNWCDSLIPVGHTRVMATANFPCDDMGREVLV